MSKLFSTALSILSLIQVTNASWILKRTRSEQSLIPQGIIETAKTVDSNNKKATKPILLTSLPEFLVEHEASSTSMYEEIYWPSDELPSNYLTFTLTEKSKLPNAELRAIFEQGPAKNRICLTFLGDGYTEAEKEKFFNDVALLVDDLFNGQTFQSYKNLFNVYAVFTPSNESGITDIKSKDTVFGLYRAPVGSKRAILPGNTDALEEAIKVAPKTDYPIVVANDDFYGGLGGRYAITTRSRESGKVVLRHELGHNFGNVGEEYDGGSVYSGANSSQSPNGNWKEWLNSSDKKVLNDMRFLGGAYVWQNLESESVVQDFRFPEPTKSGPFWFEVQVSSVGWQTLNDVEIFLDGKKLEIEGKGTSDRSFFSTKRVQDLSPGNHRLEIKENIHDGDNILAFANLYAYEADYLFNGEIGAFKTYDDDQNINFRPTHDQCLMRNMLYKFFCPVDQENMWVQFLTRIRLIDNFEVTTETISIETLNLNGLQIKWFAINDGNETEITMLQGKHLVRTNEIAKGRYVVRVSYTSSEIRKKSDHFQDEAYFDIK